MRVKGFGLGRMVKASRVSSLGRLASTVGRRIGAFRAVHPPVGAHFKLLISLIQPIRAHGYTLNVDLPRHCREHGIISCRDYMGIVFPYSH